MRGEMNDTVTPRLRILFLSLITVMVLLQVAPSLAQPSAPAKTSGQETGNQGMEKTTVPAQMEPTHSGQSCSEKSATEENWKLYVNDTYQYEICYPPSAILDSSKPQEVRLSFEEPFYISEHSNGTVITGITIKIHDNPKRFTAKEWALKAWDPDFIRGQETIDIGGVKGYKIKIFEFDQDGYHIYMSRGNKLYEIYFADPLSMPEFSKTQKKRYHELFREIVSTFFFR
jgi:hypothetical protein